MQGEFKINRCTRRCHLLDRPLTPGEWYYSVVRESDDESLARVDISAQAWNGPPEGTVGWWKSRMPEAGARKLKLAPDALLVDLLKRSDPVVVVGESSSELDDATPTELSEEPSGDLRIDPRLRYLLALMLLRRRTLKISESNPPETDEGHVAYEVVTDGSQIHLQPIRIDQHRLSELGDQLVELLYCEAD